MVVRMEIRWRELRIIWEVNFIGFVIWGVVGDEGEVVKNDDGVIDVEDL